jgi:hypothetical protein
MLNLLGWWLMTAQVGPEVKDEVYAPFEMCHYFS